MFADSSSRFVTLWTCALLGGFLSFFCASCTSHKEAANPASGGATPVRPIYYPEERGPLPAVLVLPMAGSVVSGGADMVAQKLARGGYVSRAVSYGERTSGAVLRDPVRLAKLEQVVQNGMQSLQGQPGVDPRRIGVIGFSLGGFFAARLASTVEGSVPNAAVIYYGMYEIPDEIAKLKIPLLVLQGDADSNRVFVDNALAMQKVALEYHTPLELVLYRGADHGFDIPNSPVYDPISTADAWKRTISFLDRHVKRGGQVK